MGMEGVHTYVSIHIHACVYCLLVCIKFDDIGLYIYIYGAITGSYRRSPVFECLVSLDRRNEFKLALANCIARTDWIN
jgi:hypothetical protein